MTDPMKTQIGGQHYKGMKIQPFEFAHANGYDAAAFSILKYLSRHGSKAGVSDIDKAAHIVDIRTHMIVQYGAITPPSQRITIDAYIAQNHIDDITGNALRHLHAWHLSQNSLGDAIEALKQQIAAVRAHFYEHQP